MTPAWRLWVYTQPAVVLGRSQRGLLAGAAAASTLPVLARGAGGGAVLVGPWMLGLSAAVPTGHRLAGDTPVASYGWLGEGIAQALRRVGVIGAVALPPALARQRPRDAELDWACFGGVSAWEVVVGERKIAGLAQVRRRNGVLLVAGVLVREPPWHALCRALGRPVEEDAQRLRQATTSCAAHGGAAAPSLAPALAQMLARALGLPTASLPAG